jgi:hypothetical protein
LDFAVILVAGTQAERFALGREPWYRVNWFRDDPDSDEDRAREWVGSEAARGDWDELEGHALVQLKGRGLVFTQWRAISALAQELQRHTTVLGAEIERICRENGAKQYGIRKSEVRGSKHGLRPISHEEAWQKIAAKSPRGALQVAGWRQAVKHGPVMERR